MSESRSVTSSSDCSKEGKGDKEQKKRGSKEMFDHSASHRAASWRTSTTTTSAELTWDDAADIRATWSGYLGGRIKSTERLTTNDSPPPGSSTPTCKSPVPLPSFTQSPIVDRKDEDVEISVSLGSSGRGKSHSTEWDNEKRRLYWQTAGLTRSEVEYQNRKNGTPSTLEPPPISTPSDDQSFIEVRVTSCANIFEENHSEKASAEEIKQKRSRYTKLLDELEDVRKLDHKMHGVMNRIRNDVEYELSSVAKTSSNSETSTMCEVILDYKKYLEMYPSAVYIGSEPDVLEDHIQTHLMKIRHQIKLVEKYNRALLEKKSKLSGSPINNAERMQKKSSRNYGRARTSSTIAHTNPRSRDSDKCESTEDERSIPIRKPSDPTQSHKFERYTSTKVSSKATVTSKPRKVETRVYNSTLPATHGRQINYPAVDTRKPTTIAYERWMWPNQRKMSTKNMYESPRVIRKTARVGSDRRKSDVAAQNGDFTDRSSHFESCNKTQYRDYGINPTDDDDDKKSPTTTEEDLKLMNQTFTKRKYTFDKQRGMGKVFEKEEVPRNELRTKDGQLERRTRNLWTLTESNPKTRQREIQTVDATGKELMRKTGGDATAPVPQPPLIAKKSVAFYVPLFCDNCDKTVDIESNKKGKCSSHCRNKFKWFCDTKGEDGLYDSKGPQSIQDCFKDSSCSGKVVKRSEDLLGTKFERMSNDDKLYVGMLALNLGGQEASSFLRNQCHFKGDELCHRVTKYLDIYESHKKQEYWSNKGLTAQKKNVVITEQEMRERTARLRGKDLALLEKHRKEEEERQRATNRIMQNTYALKLRKQFGKGGGKIFGYPVSISNENNIP